MFKYFFIDSLVKKIVIYLLVIVYFNYGFMNKVLADTCTIYATDGVDWNTITSTVTCDYYSSSSKTGFLKYKIDSLTNNSVFSINFNSVTDFNYSLLEVKDNKYAITGSVTKTVNINFSSASNGHLDELLVLDNIDLGASDNNYIVNISFLGANYTINEFSVKSNSGLIKIENSQFIVGYLNLESERLNTASFNIITSDVDIGLYNTVSKVKNYNLKVANKSSVKFINTEIENSHLEVDNSVVYFYNSSYKEGMGNTSNKISVLNGSYFYYKNTDDYIAKNDSIIYTTDIRVNDSTFIFDGLNTLFGNQPTDISHGFLEFENSTLEFRNIAVSSTSEDLVLIDELFVSSNNKDNLLKITDSNVYIVFDESLDFAFDEIDISQSSAKIEYMFNDVNVNSLTIDDSYVNFIINDGKTFTGNVLTISGNSSVAIEDDVSNDGVYLNFKNVNVYDVNNFLDLSDVSVSDILDIKDSYLTSLIYNNHANNTLDEMRISSSVLSLDAVNSAEDIRLYKLNILNKSEVTLNSYVSLLENGSATIDDSKVDIKGGSGNNDKGFYALEGTLIEIKNNSKVTVNTKFNSMGIVRVDNSDFKVLGEEFVVNSLEVKNAGTVYIDLGKMKNIEISKLELSNSGSIDFSDDVDLGSTSEVTNNGGSFYVRDNIISVNKYTGNSTNFRSLKANSYIGLIFEYDAENNTFGKLHATGDMHVENEIIVLNNNLPSDFVYLDADYVLAESENGVVYKSDNTEFVNFDSLYYTAKISDNSTENNLMISYECSILNTSEECEGGGEGGGEGGNYGVDKLNDANICNNGDNYLSFMEYVDNEYKNGNLDDKLTNDLAYAVAKNDPNVMNNMLAVQNTSKIKGMQGIVKSFNDILFNRNARYLNYNQEYEDSYYYGYETENNMSFWYGFNYVNKSNRYECGTNEQKTTAYTNMIGFDYVVELENQGMMIYGASLGYSFGNSSGGEFNDISTGVTQDEMNMDMSVVNFALYTGYVFGNNSLFFDVNGMFFNDKLIRTINVPNIYNIAESKSNDFVLSVNLQDTYKIELEDSMFNFEPYTRLMYNFYALDGYTEEGTNSAFVVKGENYNELLFSMGSYMNFNLEEYDYENVKPYLNFNLNYNLLNDKVVTNADFFYNNNINSSGFNVKDAEMRKFNMETGIGMIYVISETSHFNFEYSFSYDFDKSFNNQVFIKYSYKF
jgi:hypothetical protein